MRPIPLLAFLLCLFPQESAIWQHVPLEPSAGELVTAAPTPRQLATIKRALAARVKLDNWPCAEGGEPDWIDKVTVDELPLAPLVTALLVQAGPGCARGGQGANGAMWIVQFRRDKLYFLATPEQHFNGWLYSLQLERTRGVRDIVLGWHMSAGEAILTYFRFDGKLYRPVAVAKIEFDDDGAKIVPQPAP